MFAACLGNPRNTLGWRKLRKLFLKRSPVGLRSHSDLGFCENSYSFFEVVKNFARFLPIPMFLIMNRPLMLFSVVIVCCVYESSQTKHFFKHFGGGFHAAKSFGYEDYGKDRAT